MFIIQMKKAVHKPFEAPYFISSDYRVASWFFYHAPLTSTPVSMSLMKVSKDFDVEAVPADATFKEIDSSPEFKVSPLRVYGVKEAFSLPDGTTYYNWFEPKRWSFSDLPEDQVIASGLNSVVRVPMNMWHHNHIFKKWVLFPDNQVEKPEVV